MIESEGGQVRNVNISRLVATAVGVDYRQRNWNVPVTFSTRRPLPRNRTTERVPYVRVGLPTEDPTRPWIHRSRRRPSHRNREDFAEAFPRAPARDPVTEPQAAADASFRGCRSLACSGNHFARSTSRADWSFPRSRAFDRWGASFCKHAMSAMAGNELRG